jgi:uncharacterized membrane protein YfcA
MDILTFLLVGLVALFASALTFFSGFGLGTILLPVFMLFFPIDVAIAATAVVHLLNNLFKLALTARNANVSAVLRFGIPAILAAFAGAWLLTIMTDLRPLYVYQLQGREFLITPIKLVIGGLLLFFAMFELLPKAREMSFHPRYMPIGGLLSGFFGGLSGHQGALRSAFLIRSGLDKNAFIATGVAIAVMIDLARISIYADPILHMDHQQTGSLVLTATIAAFAGAYLGNKILKKVTIKAVQIIVGIMLVIFSVAMMAGLI